MERRLRKNRLIAKRFQNFDNARRARRLKKVPDIGFDAGNRNHLCNMVLFEKRVDRFQFRGISQSGAGCVCFHQVGRFRFAQIRRRPRARNRQILTVNARRPMSFAFPVAGNANAANNAQNLVPGFQRSRQRSNQQIRTALALNQAVGAFVKGHRPDI